MAGFIKPYSGLWFPISIGPDVNDKILQPQAQIHVQEWSSIKWGLVRETIKYPVSGISLYIKFGYKLGDLYIFNLSNL